MIHPTRGACNRSSDIVSLICILPSIGDFAMAQNNSNKHKRSPELVFLGTSANFLLPAFFCSCEVCEAARHHPEHRRTRAVAALLGQETTLIDAGPDLEFQLDREAIRQVDRIFITHWHYDHVWGLGALGGVSFASKSPPCEVYLPYQVEHHFDESFAYLKNSINLHPVRPGDRIDLPDATWEVVKCNHTDHSIGFIVESTQTFAYLVGSVPPAETVEKLKDLDLLIPEATLDALDEEWREFSLPKAVEFWKQTGIPRCILTHLSCHSWKDGRLIAGMPHSERHTYETSIPGLTIAYDGMRVEL